MSLFTRYRWPWPAGFAAALIGSLLAVVPAPISAAPQRQPAMARITVAGTNFSSVPAHLNAGLLRLDVVSPGKNGEGEIAIARLHSIAVKNKVAAGMSKGIDAVLPYVTLRGGVDLMPRSTQTAIFNLEPGTYVLFNLDALTADKNPHSPYRFVSVTGKSAGVAPQSTGSVRMVDFRFEVAAPVPSGFNTLKLVNAGHEPHELVLLKLAPGKALKDLQKALQSQSMPAWVQPAGGWGVLSPGQTQWLRTKLTAGNYALLCFIPDQFSYPGHTATHKSHAELGMIKVIHVG